MSNPNTATTDAALPTTGTWAIDPGHAEVGFVGRHLGLTKVRGRFTGVDGTVRISDPIEGSTIEVTIDVASVESGFAERDAHLRSSDLFSVAEHPTATFRSTHVDLTGPSSGTITGDLTIKGITRPVTLDVEFLGQTVDPWDGHRAVFSASGTVNRDDWGISWNMVLDRGGLLVSKEIRLEIEVELVQQ